MKNRLTSVFPFPIFLALLTLLSVFAPPLYAKTSTLDPEAIKGQLKILRGFTFKQDVPWQYRERADLRKVAEQEFSNDKSKDELKKIDAFLKWMQLVPDEFDVPSFLGAFLSQNVAGIYDPKNKVFYLCRDKVEGDLPESLSQKVDVKKLTALYELDRALIDQYFDLTRLTAKMKTLSNDDRSLAIQSLIEGDATYVAMDGIYKDNNLDLMKQQNCGEVIRAIFTRGQGDRKGDKTTPYFKERTAAPYVEGFRFIRDCVALGGWPMVNALYDDLPDSTEQILHTEKYLFDRDFPWIVTLGKVPEELPGGWKKLDENSVGELQMRLVLNSGSGGANRNSACEGWGGDTYRIYTRDGKSLVLWYTFWDAPGNAQKFFDAYAKLLKRKSKSAKIRKETKNMLFEAETLTGIQYMEVRGAALVILENVPPDMFTTLKDQMWQSEKTRNEHPVKVKVDPQLKKKLHELESTLNRGESYIQSNTYTNNYYGFSIQKPEKWNFKAGQANSRVPILIGDLATTAYLTVQVTTPKVAVTPALIDANINAAAISLLEGFVAAGTGTKMLSGYSFNYIKGSGTEKTNKTPCEITVFGGCVKSNVIMLIYLTPQSKAQESESDFNYMINNIKFH